MASVQKVVDAFGSRCMLQDRCITIVENHDAKPRPENVGASIGYRFVFVAGGVTLLLWIIQVGDDTIQPSNALRA